MGLSGLYLNLAGREGQGIVPAGEAEALKSRISEALTRVCSIMSGTMWRSTTCGLREQAYSGPYVSEAPDLLVRLQRGVSSGLVGLDGRCGFGGLRRQHAKVGRRSHYRSGAGAWVSDHESAIPRQVPRAWSTWPPPILAALGCPAAGPLEGNSLAAMKILVLGLDCAAPEILLEQEDLPNDSSPDAGGLLWTAGKRLSTDHGAGLDVHEHQPGSWLAGSLRLPQPGRSLL